MKTISLKMAAIITALMMTMTVTAQTADTLSTDSTRWFNQTQQLDEVVVKSRLPKTRVGRGEAEVYINGCRVQDI